MLEKYKKMGLAAATCMLLGVNSSEAAVTLTFQQVGSNVTASWSGAYNLPAGVGSLSGIVAAAVGQAQAYALNGVGVIATSNAGSFITSSLVDTNPSMYAGDNFGYNPSSLFFPLGATGDYSPSGTFTFVNRTLNDLGAGSFNNFVAYVGTGNVGGNREIKLHTASIPEPSSLFLIGLGSVALVFRRKTR